MARGRRRGIAHRGRAEVAGCVVVGNLEGHRAALVSAGIRKGAHVHEAVEGEVCAELLKDDGLRFKREEGAVLFGELRRDGDGVDTHVGTDLNDEAGILRKGKKELRFELAALAVEQVRLAHVHIVAIDQHEPVAGIGQLVRSRGGEGCHRRNVVERGHRSTKGSREMRGARSRMEYPRSCGLRRGGKQDSRAKAGRRAAHLREPEGPCSLRGFALSS